MLPLVRKLSEVERNIAQVEYYLSDGTPDEQQAMRKLIRADVCFIAYDVAGKKRFVPSKYIGHAGNTLAEHGKKEFYGGGETNRALTQLLGKEEKDPVLEVQYVNYCRLLGIEPHHKSNRRFWLYQSELTDLEAISTDSFSEGNIVQRLHQIRERNRHAVEKAKSAFRARHGGRLFCEVCSFDFKAVYGETAADLIEAHHTLPVSKMKAGHQTKPQDFAMLCANCHRMIHGKQPWLTVAQLKVLLL